MPARKITHAEWIAEAEARFGKDPFKWRFVCPVCKHVATIKDWKDAGAPESGAAQSCVGRWAGAKRDAFGLNPRKDLPPAEGSGPCNYAGYGLFQVNPVHVLMPDGSTLQAFEFAPTPQPEQTKD